jgi:hypothetical protein
VSTLTKSRVVFVGFDIDIRLLGGCKVGQYVAITIIGKWHKVSRVNAASVFFIK